MRPPVKINRDPFARASLYRAAERHQYLTCRWCGTRKQSGTLYTYFWVPDDKSVESVQRYMLRNLFCSVSCWRSYGN